MAVAARSFWADGGLPAGLPLPAPDGLVGRRRSRRAGADAAARPAGYVIGWVGFALLSHRIARAIGRAALWPRFIAAWNWCNVVQYPMLVAAGVPGVARRPGRWPTRPSWLVAMGWALWLEWYATRLALAVPGRTALALVGLDFALGIFLSPSLRRWDKQEPSFSEEKEAKRLLN